MVKELSGFEAPPTEFLNPAWKNPSILPERLGDLLQALRSDNRWVVKNHFASEAERDLLLSHPDVRVLDIERNLGDVVVSAYHHEVRQRQLALSFAGYYWADGRRALRRVLAYHDVWRTRSRRYYRSSYERLHAATDEEIARIAEFLGIRVTAARLADVRAATSLTSLRAKYGSESEGFFRRGVVGDSVNYLTPTMRADIGLLSLKWSLRRTRVFHAARAIKQTLTESTS